MVSTDVGRIGIIKRAKLSSAPARIRYSDLRSGVRAYLTDIRRSPAHLRNVRSLLEQKASDTSLREFSREDARLSIAALDAFERSSANLLGGMPFIAAPAKQPLLQLGGVDISINLDLLWQDEFQVGGALLRLAKADEADSETASGKRHEMGIYTAILVRMQVAARAVNGDIVRPDMCMSVDIQGGELFRAPRSHRQRADRLEAACRFIAAYWGSA